MFLNFFFNLRSNDILVSIKEFLIFLEGMYSGLSGLDITKFYYLARASLVKNEKQIDKFDRVFSSTFKGIEAISVEQLFETKKIPKEWIEKLAEKFLSEKEKKEIETAGGFEKLMDTLQKRLKEQEKRHEGGSKWIGTAGTSPFGAYGYNPEGIRIGQHESRNQRAVKVWDRREFKDFDGNSELGSREIKIALKRLRRWARDSTIEELDMNETIFCTAKQGYLDVKTRPERSNSVKVVIFFDVGGSMDAYIKEVEELFSAAKTAFKHLEYYYFHNCLYESVWRENRRRWTQQTPTNEVFNTFGNDYKCIFVGDAAMSPYEIEMVGGANEHYNLETGRSWLQRAILKWPKNIWINPIPKQQWNYTQSTMIINDIFEERMVPLSLNGLDMGMKILT